jgi:hypothetical protein
MHGPVQTVNLLIQLTFNSQNRKFIGDNPDLPPRTIGCGVCIAQGKNFRRGFPLLTWAKGAGRHRYLLPFEKKLAGFSNTLIFSNDPGPLEWVPSKL